GAQHRPYESDVVVGLTEKRRAPAVAGEQQRAREVVGVASAEPREDPTKVGGRCRGISYLEAHRSSDLDDVADGQRTPLLVGTDEPAHQVAALSGLFGVLVEGDTDLQPS